MTARLPTDTSTTVDVALDALRHAEAGGDTDRPILLPYTPLARLNPFQRLLYQAAWRHGVAPLPLAGIRDLEALAPVAALGVPIVAHLHWTNPVLRQATTEEDAAAAVAGALATLDRFRDGGGRIVWTIHNVMPHDTRFEAAELELRRGLVARADLVHVMAASTIDAVASRYPVPTARVLAIPHPTYAGAYPTIDGRDQARYELGLDPDERVAALVGAIHARKGLARLRDAFTELAAIDGPSRRLVVAGRPEPGGDVPGFLDWAAGHPKVTLIDRELTDPEVARVLTATDVVILPYERGLNSGAIMLGLTFGRPIVAAAQGAARELVTGDAGRTYPPDQVQGLVRAWQEAEVLDPRAVAAAIAAVTAGLDPWTVSDRFVGAIAALGRDVVDAP